MRSYGRGQKTSRDRGRTLSGYALLLLPDDRGGLVGSRFLGTANNYSLWRPGGMGTESEATLGKWMKDRRNRADLVVATKIGFNRRDIGPSLSRPTIAAEVAGSLARFGADRIDLYYAHADIRQSPLEETLETFDAPVAAGKVCALGCSNYRVLRIERARHVSRSHGWTEYCCVQ